MEHAVNIRHGRAAVVWLRVISSFAWLDSAFIGKDAKISAAFLTCRRCHMHSAGSDEHPCSR